MAELGVINELGITDTMLAIQSGKKQCALDCAWCHVELSRAAEKWEGQGPRRTKDPATFERSVGKAFGPAYDPTNFVQWGLTTHLPLCWSPADEPFQSVPQATGILEAVERFDLPLFIQTRGMNWRKVWDRLRTRADQACLYVSMGTEDAEVLARYEPSAPPPDERWALIDAAVAAGFPTMLAIAPTHAEWLGDGGLVGLVEQALARGVKGFIFDPLHLNDRQRPGAARLDPDLIRLADTAWSDRMVGMAAEARDAAVEAGASWWATSWQASVYRVQSVDPMGWIRYRDARPYPYFDALLFEALDGLTDEDDAPPLAVTWDVALAAMEPEGTAIDQPFAWGPLRNPLYCLKGLTPAWQARLKPAAPLRDYLRALWNAPGKSGFIWRHPFVRVAVRPDGSPWTSPSGDVVMIYHPDHTPKALRRVVEDLGAIDRLERVPEATLQSEE